MKHTELFCAAVLGLAYLAAQVSGAVAETLIHVCEAEDSKFLGTYMASEAAMDGELVFSNEHDMSFFRNKGFWYLGNMETWPPETHYRCVQPEGCNFDGPIPPMTGEGMWEGSKKFNKLVAPDILLAPCPRGSEEV